MLRRQGRLARAVCLWPRTSRQRPSPARANNLSTALCLAELAEAALVLLRLAATDRELLAAILGDARFRCPAFNELPGETCMPFFREDPRASAPSAARVNVQFFEY